MDLRFSPIVGPKNLKIMEACSVFHSRFACFPGIFYSPVVQEIIWFENRVLEFRKPQRRWAVRLETNG